MFLSFQIKTILSGTGHELSTKPKSGTQEGGMIPTVERTTGFQAQHQSTQEAEGKEKKKKTTFKAT